jgi:hypothetical protein
MLTANSECIRLISKQNIILARQIARPQRRALVPQTKGNRAKKIVKQILRRIVTRHIFRLRAALFTDRLSLLVLPEEPVNQAFTALPPTDFADTSVRPTPFRRTSTLLTDGRPQFLTPGSMTVSFQAPAASCFYWPAALRCAS